MSGDGEPTCPKCGAPMEVRTARRGRNAGGQFLGCSTYPSCRGTRDLAEQQTPSGETDDQSTDRMGDSPVATPTETGTEHQHAVVWADASILRRSWIGRFTHGGASLRTVDAGPLPELDVAWIASPDLPAYAPGDQPTQRVIGVARKILQRGSAPPIDPAAEHSLLTKIGYENIDPFNVLERTRAEVAPIHAGLFADESEPDAALADQASNLEPWFLSEWLAAVLGPAAPRWFAPQARLDLVAGSRGLAGPAIAVDFLCVAPWLEPFVVEIDGAQHEMAADADAARDEIAAQCGLDVIRIPASELHAQAGPGIQALRERWEPPPAGISREGLAVAIAPAQLHRLALALLEGLALGFLAGDRWEVDVTGPFAEDVVELVGPYLDLFAAVEGLWAPGTVLPERVLLDVGDRSVAFVRTEGRYESVETGVPQAATVDMRVDLDIHRTPYETLPSFDTTPVVVVRSANLPVPIRDATAEGNERARPDVEHAEVAGSLATIARSVFAIPDFRQGQLEAVLEVLSGRDCTVLLPTGAGKSLIYQLAGLCLPGRTVMVYPLTALIEDQAHGLRRNGIERITPITRDILDERGDDAVLREVSSGDALFILVTPERLQNVRFREALAQMSAMSPVALVGLDEAHCVSEWGHDFRPAYLLAGETLRRLGGDTSTAPLPMLALTGTASRAVLNDVLLQVGLRVATDNSIVRPKTFDRPELSFSVSAVEPKEADARLRGVLQGLPGKFNQAGSRFFEPLGHRTHSGIVFCQTVNGRRGILAAQDEVTQVTNRPPGIYSGKQPKKSGLRGWAKYKRETAAAFKANDLPALVSTKAFGMGIDKPNVRWVVHWGLPGSIEAWYQEVGRAGRDKRPSHCELILTEYDEERDRNLLQLDRDTEALRELADVPWAQGDCITTALFFLLNSFQGVEAELSQLTALVDQLEPDDRRKDVSIRSGGDSTQHALARLIRLGVVSDYTVRGSSLDITVEGTQPADVLDRLEEYIERSQAGRGELTRQRVQALGSEKLAHVIRDAGEALIEFVYDTIYRSRLRSIREMWLAARMCDGEVLRRRTLDYLQEGDATVVLEELLSERHFVLGRWAEALHGVRNQRDAAEWRGAAARLLQSDPDHTGLLFVRFATELLLPEPDFSDVESNLELMIDRAPIRFGLSGTELDELGKAVLDLARVAGETAHFVAADVLWRRQVASADVRRSVAASASGDDDALHLSALLLSIELGSQLALVAQTDELLKRRTL